MKYSSNAHNSQEEKGTRKDVKGVDGRKEHMRHSHHEMGSYSEGTHYHDHHKGK